MKIRSSQTRYAICCCTGIGPSFGSGSDIRICEKMDNCTNLGYTYPHPENKRGTNEVQFSTQTKLKNIKKFRLLLKEYLKIIIYLIIVIVLLLEKEMINEIYPNNLINF